MPSLQYRPKPSLRNRLLIAASGPESPNDQALHVLIREIRKEWQEPVGVALLFFGPGGKLADAEMIAASMPRGEDEALLLHRWCTDAHGPARRTVQSANTVEESAGYPSLPESCGRALWVPLKEGRRRVQGVLLICRNDDAPFSEVLQTQAEEVAQALVPALNRLLLRRRLAALDCPHEVVGVSPAFLELERKIRLVAQAHGPVLVLGERGSGKEMVATALHAWSPRRREAFVPVLASAFPESMVADELFGHERHSFTGAQFKRLGKFAAANGGTVFLDEVGDLPMPVQSSLMRVLDKGELPRVGRDLPLPIDVRVVTATNRDMEGLMEHGSFRRDLYDRLRVLEVRVPPLKERPEDIPLLASAFLRHHCQNWGRASLLADVDTCPGQCHASLVSCTGEGLFERLTYYSWPGNVRELKNVIEALVTGAPDEVLLPEHLPRTVRSHRSMAAESGQRPTSDLSLDGALRTHIGRILSVAGNNQSQAARLLDVPLSTLRNKMKRLGMELPDGRRAGSRRPVTPARHP